MLFYRVGRKRKQNGFYWKMLFIAQLVNWRQFLVYPCLVLIPRWKIHFFYKFWTYNLSCSLLVLIKHSSNKKHLLKINQRSNWKETSSNSDGSWPKWLKIKRNNKKLKTYYHKGWSSHPISFILCLYICNFCLHSNDQMAY